MQTETLILTLQRSETPAWTLEDSEDWLSTHSLKSKELTLTDLIHQGATVLKEPDGSTQKMHFSTQAICLFESKLSDTIELYHQRMKWLTDGSKKAFGLIKGTRVGILIDLPVSGGPQEEFQSDFTILIDEQLSFKEKLYVLSFGITTKPLWPDPVEVSTSTLQELKLWVKMLQPEKGSNLLQALKKVFTVKGLNSLVIILRSCPDQTSEVLSDYIQQSTLGWDLSICVITYKCDNLMPSAVLKNFTEALGGSYHCYSPKSEIYTNKDVDELLAETQKAQSLLSHVQALRHSSPCEELANMIKEISSEIVKGPFTGLLPKPPKHEGPLTIEFPNLEKTSVEWLKINGLKAKKLSLYQVLAPNAFSPVEDFVPILQKMVSSTIHEKAMVQFEWHDGTMKNIHVDPPFLYEYQKQLGKAVRMYERRVEWLSLASRRIWGTICERRVVILLDVSVTNSTYIIHIQHSVRLLLEEQLSNKDCFNLIAFGSTIESWKPEMVPVSHENLQSAWRWVLGLRCRGSRNILGALRKAVEVDFRDKSKHESQGIYLFTGGIPDQDVSWLSAYMSEACGGCDLQLNVCLFYVGERQVDSSLPVRYANRTDTSTAYKEITRVTGGRFHWFGDTGIYESDDINAIISEMEKALNYSQKCAFLLASLKHQSEKDLESPTLWQDKAKTTKHSQPKKLCPPKPTAPSNIKDDLDNKKSPPLKTLKCRSPNGKAGISPVQPGKEKTVEQRKKTEPKATKMTLSLFYTESGNHVGSVYKKYRQRRGLRRTYLPVELPKKVIICSSEEWVANYGLKKLNMELSRCPGPSCRHQKSGGKATARKYCSSFPTIEINGVMKHIHWTLWEMEVYISDLEKVMRCYVRRLQWLLSGSRRLFGTILESKVCILLDTSGSMGPYLQQVKTDLVLLIWEQLRKHCDSFSLLSFAERLQLWQNTLVKTTESTCHEAMQWVTRLQAQGSTSVLPALLKAFDFHDLQGLYFLTDGKPDTSFNLVLNTIQRLRNDKDVRVHTISLNCENRAAVEFLRKLASLTGGRYHCPAGEDTLSGIHGMLTRGFIQEGDPKLPVFQGDDLNRLAQEITKARNLLRQAHTFRSHLQKEKNIEPKEALC